MLSGKNWRLARDARSTSASACSEQMLSESDLEGVSSSPAESKTSVAQSSMARLWSKNVPYLDRLTGRRAWDAAWVLLAEAASDFFISSAAVE